MYSLVITDDEAVLRDGLAKHFPWGKYGFVVKEIFANPKKALAFFNGDTADVLLTDIRMPYMSGLELIRRIKENPENKTIICLLSAYRDFTYAQEAMAMGIKYYLLKPTSFEEIGEIFGKIKTELDEMSPSVPAVPEFNSSIIKRVFSIMITKTASCTLNSIAAELDLDISYLSRFFKKETGENFRDAFQRIKMEMAVEMLTGNSNYKNYDISSALGYQDSQNFCRIFKEYYGLSPGKFKKKVLNDKKPPVQGISLP